MSVTWMDDWQRNPAAYVRKQLEALSRLDADRCAFVRQQRGASSGSGEPKPHHLASDRSGAPENPEAA